MCLILSFKEKRKCAAIESKMAMQQRSMKKIFRDDQVWALTRRSTKGMAWSTETVKHALHLRYSLGSSGYQELLRLGYPLPSTRTLQGRVQHNADLLDSDQDVATPHVCESNNQV